MATLIEELTEKVQAFKAPIPGSSPAGSDLSYETEFETIKAEVDKLASMTGEQPNWREIVRLGEELTKNKSKDFRILTWTAIGRMRQDGLRGLAEGLLALREVSADHWDAMFPPARRARARGNQAGWLMEQAAQFLQDFSPTAADREPFTAVNETLDSIDTFLSDKLADAYSGMGGLRSVLREKERMLPAEAPPAAAAPEPAAPVAAASAPLPAAAAPVAGASSVPQILSDADVMPALRALGSAMTEAAEQIRGFEPSQPMAYRLLRLGTWLTVESPPPVEAGRTRIPPPDDADRQQLESLASGEQWRELLNVGEGLVSQYIFWLDVHRYVALAMDRLGALFLEARDTLGREVVAFVQRFPSLPSLKWSDGTPLMDAATEAWLADEQKKHGGGGAGAGSGRVDEEEQELVTRFEEAKEMVVGGKLPEGLALAAALASRGADARARFRSRLQVGRLAIQAGKVELARPLLEGLVTEGERHRLDEWEPALAASLYSSLLAAWAPDREESEEGRPVRAASALTREEVFARLCRLDPAAALKLAGR